MLTARDLTAAITEAEKEADVYHMQLVVSKLETQVIQKIIEKAGVHPGHAKELRDYGRQSINVAPYMQHRLEVAASLIDLLFELSK